jgi:hypothetical protein
MSWKVQGSNPTGGGGAEARISSPHQTGPEAQPATNKMDNGSLSRGVKQQGRRVNYLPYLVPGLKKEYSYTSTSLWFFVSLVG